MSVASPIRSPTFDDCEYLSEQATAEDFLSREHQRSDENFPQLSKGRVTFTPRRAKSQPRAWERKPSTPFAPRIDGQRIWKRAPLQLINANTKHQWHKNDSQTDLNARPVKRLRIGAGNSEEEKENATYINVKWEDSHPNKSPRRRVPARDVVDLQSTLEPEINLAHLLVQHPEKPQTPKQHPQVLPFGDIESGRESVGAYIDAEEVVAAEDPLPGQSPSEPSHAATEHMLGEADVFLRISAESSPTSSPSTPASSGFSPINLDLINQTVVMSPKRRKSVTPVRSKSHQSPPGPEAGGDLVSQILQAPKSTSEDPDDTSYLQDFLLRSRAQKAARRQSALLPPDDTVEIGPLQAIAERDDEIEVEISSTDPFDTDTNRNPQPENVKEVDGEAASEAKTSPPCRRSSRTRLPRLQKQINTIPSNIALRRFVGNEFISSQREAQSMATATRNNTRNNKGPAIAVQARLLQLKKEDVTTTEDADTPSKKRKTVVWAEVLAQFQDYTGPEPFSSPETDDTTGQPVDNVDKAPENAENESQAEPKAKEDETDRKKSSKRVRKLRKDSVGSVNGTPAPKRSIEILLEDARAANQHTSIATPSKRTRSKSRS